MQHVIRSYSTLHAIATGCTLGNYSDFTEHFMAYRVVFLYCEALATCKHAYIVASYPYALDQPPYLIKILLAIVINFEG